MKSNDKKLLRVPYGQAVHDEAETKAVVAVLNAHQTIMGPQMVTFEKNIARLFGKKYGLMVNSGSSANYLVFDILKLPAGSEVITPLLTFSTTVAPIVKAGLVPVFADVVPGQYIINIDQIESLITKKTKALMIPLLLGNVPDMKRLQALARKNNLYLIEDSCDTLAACFDGKPSGAYTDITTTSFYGSHIITAGGNGGMILVNRKDWADRIKVLRGWGRSSSLFSESESIAKRFKYKLEGIAYDAKFIFDEVGYNLLGSEMGAAFGNVQLKKLPRFRQIRENNFASLRNFFKDYEDFFILPSQDKRVNTQWLAFPLTIKKSAPFTRLQIVTYLEKNNVQTRPIFTGNILKQPGFKNISYKMVKGGCPTTDEVMHQGFVVGCHHGLTIKHIDRLKELFSDFLKKYR